MNTANGTIDHTRSSFSLWSLLASFIVMVAAFALTAPWVQAAPGGGGGKFPGPFVHLSGTVTNAYTGLGIEGATITLEGGGLVLTLVTDANGKYQYNKTPIGTFAMTTSAPNYSDDVQQAQLLKGKRTVDVSLTPNARVIVNASVEGTAEPGASLTANGSYIIMDGSSFISSAWSQGAEGVPATIGAGDSASVDLEDADAYAAHLKQVLKEPPITAADLPPDLVLRPITEEAHSGLQDRNQVVAIDPKAMEEDEALPLIYTVDTTSGTYTEEVPVAVSLPWPISTGVRTVPVDSTVLLYAKDDTAWNWMMTSAPNGSQYADPNNHLDSFETQTPWFTPDVVGTYMVEETNSGATIEVHAGRYLGVIDPTLTLNSVLYGDGRPVTNEPGAGCLQCHKVGGAAPANFDTWRLTGHAEAFTQGITTNGHFGENCFACHAVGFGTTSGIDSTVSYDAFLNLLASNQSSGDIAGTWEEMLVQMPDTARLSNIQCENCHGPQQYTSAHHTPDSTPDGTPRVRLGSEVCGSCHGEPARHGRYQQWQLSNHADYDLARSRGASSGNCARCHSGNGFIAWNELDFDPDETVDVTWSQETVVPQTCPTCHNPHDTGTTSGSDETDARVRVNAFTGGTCGGTTDDPERCDTYQLIAGFTAISVGRGATCMTCHNSRAEDPRNDANWPNLSDSEKAGGPHHGVQADLIMGKNMYFFAPGELVRGKHSYITDTCITCHMEKTDPPDILSYNHGGTNHTFAANPLVCANSGCHAGGDPNAATIDGIITGLMSELETALGAGYKRVMEAHYPVAAGGGCNPADGTTGHEITAVTWNYGGHSGATLDIAVSDGSSCTGRSLSSIQVAGGSLLNTVLNPANGAEDLLKARWNYGMNYEDETIIGCVDEDDPNCNPPHTHRGVHNPDLQIKSLERATSAVNGVLSP